MAQRKPRRKSGAKIATKKEQAELLQRARALADDPSPLVPEASRSTQGVARRLEKRLHRVSKARENQRRLKAYLKRGPELTRAYANLLLVAASDQAGRMASTSTPVGDLKFALRGMAPRQACVAVQHYRYPQVRVLAYRDIARKVGLVWATPDGVSITMRKEAPPQAWLDVVFQQAPVDLQSSPERDGLVVCPHLAGGQKGDDRSPLAIEMGLDAGPITFRVCESCVRERLAKREKGLLATVVGLVVGLKPRHITARVTGTPRVCVHEGDCAWERHAPRIPDSTLTTYREGRRSEAELLDRILPLWEDRVKAADELLLAAGTRCYGEDKQAFLDAVGETGDRREALERFLRLGPRVVIAKDVTMNHVLEACWEVAPQVLKELHPYPDELETLLRKHAKSPPAAVVDEVLEARRALAVLKGYPRYDSLPPAARAAHRLARAYRTGGDAAMNTIVEKELDDPTQHKGVLWAALRLSGQQAASRWRFDKISIEAGEFLEEPLKALMEADASDYHERLAHLHTLAGGQGNLPAPTGTV